MQVRTPSFVEKLKKLAELNFCEECYHKYLTLIHGGIELLLSEPLSDWRRVETNIDLMWIKAKGYYKIVNSTIFSPNEEAFNRAKKETVKNKSFELKKKGILRDYTFQFLNKVRVIRNKLHPQYNFSDFSENRFSEQDYILFRQARELTDTMFLPIIHDIKDDRGESTLVYVENYAKKLLSKL